MSKKSSRAEIKSWLSENADAREGRFIQVGNSLMLSKRFHKLTASARFFYFALAMEAGPHRQAKFTHGAAYRKYGIASSTYDRSLQELEKAGFVKKIEPPNHELYVPNVLEFSSEWKADLIGGISH